MDASSDNNNDITLSIPLLSESVIGSPPPLSIHRPHLIANASAGPLPLSLPANDSPPVFLESFRDSAPDPVPEAGSPPAPPSSISGKRRSDDSKSADSAPSSPKRQKPSLVDILKEAKERGECLRDAFRTIVDEGFKNLFYTDDFTKRWMSDPRGIPLVQKHIVLGLDNQQSASESDHALSRQNAVAADTIRFVAYSNLDRVGNSLTLSDQAIAVSAMDSKGKSEYLDQAWHHAKIARKTTRTQDLLECISFAQKALEYVRKNRTKKLSPAEIRHACGYEIDKSLAKAAQETLRKAVERKLANGVAYLILLRHTDTATIMDNDDWSRWDVAQDCLPIDTLEFDRMLAASSPSKFVLYWEHTMRRSKSRYKTDDGKWEFDEDALHKYAKSTDREKDKRFKVKNEKFEVVALLKNLVEIPVCGEDCSCV